MPAGRRDHAPPVFARVTASVDSVRSLGSWRPRLPTPLSPVRGRPKPTNSPPRWAGRPRQPRRGRPWGCSFHRDALVRGPRFGSPWRRAVTSSWTRTCGFLPKFDAASSTQCGVALVSDERWKGWDQDEASHHLRARAPRCSCPRGERCRSPLGRRVSLRRDRGSVASVQAGEKTPPPISGDVR